MSGQMTFKTYEEVVDYVKNYQNPICFQVNYLPETDEYDLWIGNQPYRNYEKWLTEMDDQISETTQRFNNIQKENVELSILLRDTQIKLIDAQQQSEYYREMFKKIYDIQNDEEFNPYAYMMLEIIGWAEDSLKNESRE